MSEEQAFLDQLKANPGDDLTRLVYADWLEERGDARAAYLRAEQQLAALSEDDPRFATLDQLVSQVCRTLDADWLFAAGRRWDVWLLAYERPLIIPVIQALREVIGCGLAEAKEIVQTAPRCVVRGCQRAQGEAVRDHLIRCIVARLVPPAPPLPHVRVSIRPCPVPGPVPPLRQPPAYFDLMILGPHPGREEELIARLRHLFLGEEDARHAINNRLAVRIFRTTCETYVREVAARWEEVAVLEIQRLEPPLVPIPPVTSAGTADPDPPA